MRCRRTLSEIRRSQIAYQGALVAPKRSWAITYFFNGQRHVRDQQVKYKKYNIYCRQLLKGVMRELKRWEFFFIICTTSNQPSVAHP